MPNGGKSLKKAKGKHDMNALKTQVVGGHYTKLRIQPLYAQPPAVAEPGEREAFESWIGIKPCGAAHDFGWQAWKARAMLAAAPKPAQQPADGVVLDAERYRWLRDRMLGVDLDWCESGVTALAFEMPDGCAYGGDCDQNIDAAIAAHKAQEGDA